MSIRSFASARSLVIALVAALFLLCPVAYSQTLPRVIRTHEYQDLQKRLASGWNTWYNNSVMTHVLLPEGFAVSLSLMAGPVDIQREYFKVSRATNRKEDIVPGIRSDDGNYTSLTCTLGGTTISVQTASVGGELLVLVTPQSNGKAPGHHLVVEASILWNRPGTVGRNGLRLVGLCAGRTLALSPVEPPADDPYAPVTAPHFVFSLDKPVHLYTGKPRSADEIDRIIERKREEQVRRAGRYDTLAQAFTAMQTILSWNAIYDAGNGRVISPVSRWWNAGWGGFVLFDWDTYFASYMYSLFNKDLAYANAIEITKSITPGGFIPNYSAPAGTVSWDRSQPSIGSFVVNEIYKRYRERWFLEETYDELLSWNRWWPEHRTIKGYLAWGSDMVPDTLRTIEKHNAQAAMFESGLDNSPMYDGVPFNASTNTLELADVGLMSFYVMDCNALAEIATLLGKKADADELRQRGKVYAARLGSLWDETSGIYLNRRTDTGEPSPHLSPTNFYPMIAKVCSPAQAQRMMKEHYFNPREFHGEYVLPSIARCDSGFRDNNYWRGRIWAPMNFLVYLGMRNYDVAGAREDLIHRSFALLMKSWKKNGCVYENYNSVTGQGDDVGNADGFYHWGALLAFMTFIERGYLR
jgi:putative isomerase